METIITSEKDLREYKHPFSHNVRMVHFKMVGIGPNTLAQAEYLGAKVCDIATIQPGYFVISGDGNGLRQAMHDLVDRFCNAQEGKHESENSKSTGS